MKVASKLALVTWLAFMPVLGVHAWLSVRREDELFRLDMERDLSVLAEHLRQVARTEWALEGASDVGALLDSAAHSDRGVRIRWQPGNLATKQRGVTAGDRDEIVWSEPVEIDGRLVGRIQLAESLAPMRAYVRRTLLRIGVLSLALGAAGALLASLLGHRVIGRRLDALLAFAARVGAGHLGERADVGGRDEISSLALRLGEMSEQLAAGRRQMEAANAERLALLQQLRHEDRLATVGRLAGGVAHELGTPLNVLMGHADRLGSGSLTPGEVEHATRVIRRTVARMTATIRSLLGFVRRVPNPTELVDPVRIVESVCDLIAPLAEQRGVELVAVAGGDTGTQVRGNGVQLEQALSNLVVNAIDASVEGGRIEIAVERSERVRKVGGARRVIAIHVRDWGTGVAAEQLDRVFEPFFTSKPEGAGTGLGLWLAQGIAEDHGGWIEVTAPADGGSRFTLLLPEEDG